MSTSTTVPDVPAALAGDSIEARIIKEKIWDRMWVDNEHFMAVVVGREGSGKSYTGIKLSELVDPTFNADRVMFDPLNFLEHLQEWKAENNTQGKMVVIDEAGVGVGVRTWYDKEQIAFNQILQIIRDENMGLIFTLPRLEELDSQTEGRLHAYMEMTDKRNGEWAKLKWLKWDPTRDGRNKVYREYPKMRIDGVKRSVKRLCVGPPSDDVVEAYAERKTAFQTEQYQGAIDDMEEDVDDERTVKEIAVDISEDQDISDYIAKHGHTGRPYIDDDLIRVEYDMSVRDAEAVKSLLNKEYDEEQLEDLA